MGCQLLRANRHTPSGWSASLMKILEKIKDWLYQDQERIKINSYLSESTDMVDLERRMRQIDRGQAPWQQNAINKARGWL